MSKVRADQFPLYQTVNCISYSGWIEEVFLWRSRPDVPAAPRTTCQHP